MELDSTYQRDTMCADWSWPSIEEDMLRHAYGDSILLGMVEKHGPADVLRELVQNEYDAEGRHMQVTFGVSNLRITGKGKPIDPPGWLRLSLTMGTGVDPTTRRRIRPKY